MTTSAVLVDGPQVLAILDPADAEAVSRALGLWGARTPLSPALSELQHRLSSACAVIRERAVRTSASLPQNTSAQAEVGAADETLGSVKVGHILGVDPRWVRELAVSGRLPAQRGSRGWTFSRRDVEQYLEARKGA